MKERPNLLISHDTLMDPQRFVLGQGLCHKTVNVFAHSSAIFKF